MRFHNLPSGLQDQSSLTIDLIQLQDQMGRDGDLFAVSRTQNEYGLAGLNGVH